MIDRLTRFWKRLAITFALIVDAQAQGLTRHQTKHQIQLARADWLRQRQHELKPFGFHLDPGRRCEGRCGKAGQVFVRADETWCLECGYSYFRPETRDGFRAAGLFWERKA